jgi:hypothetical protein
VFDYRETEGSHAWRWWTEWLRERHLPFLLARLADPRPASVPAATPPPPVSFRYRSVAPQFSVWGYAFHLERAVREFLDLDAVGAEGLIVRGSGRATVQTAPVYSAGRSYVVSGAEDDVQTVVADMRGRLTFTVDLGPSHTAEQYSAAATALEAAGNYWTERVVEIAAP